MYGGPFGWQSKLKPTPASNISEAEYQAANAGGREALRLRKVMRDVGRPVFGPVVVQCDNTSAIALMMNNDMSTVGPLIIESLWAKNECLQGHSGL